MPANGKCRIWRVAMQYSFQRSPCKGHPGIGTGLLQLTLTEQIAQLLGLPAVLKQENGLGIFAFVALTIYVANRSAIPQAPLRVLIALNGLWAMACVWVAFGANRGHIAPTIPPTCHRSRRLSTYPWLRTESHTAAAAQHINKAMRHNAGAGK